MHKRADAQSAPPGAMGASDSSRSMEIGSAVNLAALRLPVGTARRTAAATTEMWGRLLPKGRCRGLLRPIRVARAEVPNISKTTLATDGWLFWRAKDQIVGDVVTLKELRRRQAAGPRP